MSDFFASNTFLSKFTQKIAQKSTQKSPQGKKSSKKYSKKSFYFTFLNSKPLSKDNINGKSKVVAKNLDRN